MGFFDFLKRKPSPEEEDEAAQSMQLACTHCKNKYPMAAMSYDKSGQNLACPNCVTKSLPPKPKMQEPEQKFSNKQYMPTGYENKTPFICSDCGYKFSRHASYKASMRCSYCSSGNVRLYEPMRAQDVLNHSENPERLFKY